MRLASLLPLTALLVLPALTACRTADTTGPSATPSFESQGSNNASKPYGLKLRPKPNGEAQGGNN